MRRATVTAVNKHHSGFVVLAAAAILLHEAPCPAQPLDKVSFAVFDTETTGLSSRKDRLVEIGVVKFRAGKITARKSWLIDPGIPIPDNASMVHGITDAMVERAPGFADVYPDFCRFVTNTVLLGHHASFDVGFLQAEAARHRLTLPRIVVLDTLTLARARFPDAPSHALQSLSTYLNLNRRRGRPHRALSDARLTVMLFLAATSHPPPVRTMEELEAVCGGRTYLSPQPAPQSPRSERETNSQNSSAGPSSKDSRIRSTACVALRPER